MANPNIVGVTSIYGGTKLKTLGTEAAIYSNGSTSGSIVKVNSIIIANIGSTAADVSIGVQDTVNDETSWIAKGITVPDNATLVVSDKNTSFYLLEGFDLLASASSTNTLSATVSYEIIS